MKWNFLMARKLTYEELEQRVKESEKEVANSKWAERAVRESEEKFRAITGSAKDAIIMMDNEGHISYWNEAAERIFGYSAHEALGRELHTFLAPQEYQDACQRGILTFKTTGHGPVVGKTLELEGERKDGTRFPLELSVSAVMIEDKWHATGIVRDIIERKQADEKLQEMRDYLENLLNYANAPIIVWDPAFRITRFNHAFERLTGRSADEVVGAPLDILFPEDRREGTMAHIRSTGAGERWEVVEIPILHADGTVRIVLWNSANIYAEDRTTVIATIAQGQDITERRQAQDALIKAHDELEQRVEERTAKLAMTTEQLKLELAGRKRVEESLRQSEKRFRSVAQTASDGIITIDSRGNIVFWNDAAEKIFGYSSDQAMGQLITLIIPERFGEDQRNDWELPGSMGPSGIVGKTVEEVGRRKDDSEFPVELSIARWETEEGVFFTGIVRDVTDRKRAEEEIRHLSRQLIRVIEQERKRLTRDLHDELGQTLTGLHFSAEALYKSLPEELKDQKTRCDELIEVIEQLGDNIRNISSELRPDMLDHLGLIPTLEWYIEDFTKRISGLQIDFQTIGVRKRPDAEIEIVLYRIVQEALNNIAKHVSILLTYSHPKLISTIKDDGIGFERMEGMLPSGPNKGGIGLLGMRERVGSLGGTINIHSNRGKGTVIRVELPVSLIQAEV
ncbi:MAG: hypothetical protein BA861_01585 [Desulfobacterales bacterium S3730MH5]|nr:MAG: hypothetical protein BA861_01585 [Desulfobacterales bacterium S3730MH5]